MNHKNRFSLFARVAFVALALAGLLAGRAADVISLQPGPGANDGSDDGTAAKGVDAGFTYAPVQGGNYGAGAYLDLFNSPCNAGYYPVLLKFALDDLPKAGVESAKLKVYAKVFFNGAGWPWQVSPVVSVRRVVQPWNEMEVTLATLPELDPTALSSQTVPTVGGGSWGSPFTEFEGWLEFDLSGLYKDWVAGTRPNHGLALTIDNSYCANGDNFWIYSSDYLDDPTLRPTLVVTAQLAVPPAFTTAPQAQTVLVGAPASFSVSVSGTEPFEYQWTFNGKEITGATNASYTIGATAPGDVGLYGVTVRNAAGTTNSPTALLSLDSVDICGVVTLYGPIGTRYQVDWRNEVNPGAWQTLTNVVLPSSPFVIVDLNSTRANKRFYRTTQIP